MLSSPHYDLQRFGLGIVASPRHADLLLVTGAVTSRMREPLLVAYDALPEPRRVAALGDCALGCNLLGTTESLLGPVEDFLPDRRPHPRLPALAQHHRGGAPGVARRPGLTLAAAGRRTLMDAISRGVLPAGLAVIATTRRPYVARIL